MLLTVDGDDAGVDGVDAGERLDQGRLAGAVLAHEGVHLAGEEPHRDLVEGADGAEGDRDVAHLDHRLRVRRGHGRRSPAGVLIWVISFLSLRWTVHRRRGAGPGGVVGGPRGPR